MIEKKTIDLHLVERVCARTASFLAGRRIPESTYRLQFHAGFTFRDAARIAPYLRALGVTHCYASPYLRARPGSTHGYDIVDHGSLNPEIGSEEDFNAWIKALDDNDLGHIVDTVPNHMGVGTNENAWWNDVLENGPASRYANHFDVSWRASARPELRDKILLPVLGEPYGESLDAGKLALIFDNGAIAVGYHDRVFPLDPRTYPAVLANNLEELARDLGTEAPAYHEYQSILTACRNLPGHAEAEAEKIAERNREKEIIKGRLASLTTQLPAVREFIEKNLRLFNGQSGNPKSFDLLHELLESQRFRLSYWRVALDEINYRRFFDVNDLAALNIEREEVFGPVHALLLRFAGEGKIEGLRIDHPDGLYDPAQYFTRLQERFVAACAKAAAESDPELAQREASECDAVVEQVVRMTVAASKRPLFVVVEKILAADEKLAENWAVHGTSGYDFLNLVNGVFVDTANAGAFDRIYHDFVGDETRFGDLAYRKKLLILQTSLASELHTLTHQLDHLAQKSRASRDFTFNTLRHALRAVIACFPVYRSYIAGGRVHDDDRRNIQGAVRRATIRNPLISRRVFQFVRGMLLLETPAAFSAEDEAEQRRFAGKFQQVTAPVVAKGIEDTAFYVYNRLLSLNEVGGDPARFGDSPETLHAAFRERQTKWPFALSALSTHDTKRSEDVRARLNVLSEMPDAWREGLERWARLNAPHRQQVDDRTAPSANEEYMFYQTLLGAWPLETPDAAQWADFLKRMTAFMEKATREAKEHTSWINPNPDYDRAISEFTANVLDLNANRPFLDDFRVFQRRISHYGLFNSLAQTLLKLNAPGVPDTYQGTEVWDFSLVDPDNRRPVDYGRRQTMLHELQTAMSKADDRNAFLHDLLANREDGRIKLYVTSRALQCRRDHPGLFSDGVYVPLKVTGEKANHVIAFARNYGDHWAVVAVPRLIATLAPNPNTLPIGKEFWGDTQISLEGVPETLQWRNVLTESLTAPPNAALGIAELLGELPVALLLSIPS